MAQTVELLTKNFQELELCLTINRENKAEIQTVANNQPSTVSNWLRWFGESSLEIDFFRVSLADKSNLIFKRIYSSDYIVIHNSRENLAMLLSFIKGIDHLPELIKEDPEPSGSDNGRPLASDLKMLEAQRIQQLIIPPENELQANFKEFFVVHQQQDVVGGDFYWYKKIEDDVLLALVDCTGHSIEGAMTSMVCNSLLNQASENFDGSSLSQFVRLFYQRLETYNRTAEDMLDYGIGAEIGVFCFSPKQKQARFASTGISAFIKKKSGLELLKAKKCMDYSKLGSLSDQVISLEDVTGIYSFTDGLTDQFDSQDNKKLGYRGVKDMIAREEAFNASYYSKALNSWKGDNIQYDDITMIGIAV